MAAPVVLVLLPARAALADHDVNVAATDTRTAPGTALGTGASRCLDLVRNTLLQSLEP
ncbi:MULTISPECIES: hypothetical protein [unclassified Streptomyces]|uniref:hypothetical protein n=1 Tax=unclassified Streptomyces TaxID=2593676 RepID=UPI00331C9F80